ncbi:Hypothetical protein PFR_JS23-PH_66, partial [Propionibacterium freudenreichii]
GLVFCCFDELSSAQCSLHRVVLGVRGVSLCIP